MSGRDPEADAVFRDILASYAGSPAMASKRMFGSDALLVDGKIACFVSKAGRLVAKLPDATSQRLLAAGSAEPMAMGGRRPMTGWFSIPLTDELDWFALAAEAVEHVHALETEQTSRAG
jgi:TfoX/Sxy family transcriptional regulator of competence genes